VNQSALKIISESSNEDSRLLEQRVFVAVLMWHYAIKEQINGLRDGMGLIQNILQLLLLSFQLKKVLERQRMHKSAMQVKPFQEEDPATDWPLLRREYYKGLLEQTENRYRSLSGIE
jgi:hypothetical protein